MKKKPPHPNEDNQATSMYSHILDKNKAHILKQENKKNSYNSPTNKVIHSRNKTLG